MGAGELVLIGFIMALPFIILWGKGISRKNENRTSHSDDVSFKDNKEKSEKNN